MRVVVQRVSRAEVRINGEEPRCIGPGLLLLLGVESGDTEEDAGWLVDKLLKLRIFDDADGITNLSMTDVAAEVMVISQFTLLASTKKGTRPSYHRAAKPELARELYGSFVRQMENETGRDVPTGTFGAHMDVELVNDGPVTLLLDSKNRE